MFCFKRPVLFLPSYITVVIIYSNFCSCELHKVSKKKKKTFVDKIRQPEMQLTLLNSSIAWPQTIFATYYTTITDHNSDIILHITTITDHNSDTKQTARISTISTEYTVI